MSKSLVPFVFSCAFLSLALGFVAANELPPSLLETLREEPKKPAAPPLPPRVNQFRKDFSTKIRRGNATLQDYTRCKEGVEQLTLFEHKMPFRLLMAQYQRVVKKNPVSALEILAPIILSEESATKWISAQRTECYLIKVLTQLSNPAVVRGLSNQYENLCEELEDAKAQMRSAKRMAAAEAYRQGLEAYAGRLAFAVRMYEKTPRGREALLKAEERAEKFLDKNKYGLYRGEVLLDIGTAHLVSNFDVASGEKWLSRAAEWFDNVAHFDKDLKEFELPEQVKRASAPPKDERYKDRWNNILVSKPRPGDLFNRRSCSWYANAKQKDVVLLQGLCQFAKEDYEAAETCWNRLSELDKEFYAQQKAAGFENATTLARLQWNLRNQKGSLYATPEEMACFTDPKRRLAVLIADLYYESEKPEQAIWIYRRLERGELGQLSKNEKAYAVLGVFSCLCRDKRYNEIEYIINKAPLFENTPSERRALFFVANRVGGLGTSAANEYAMRTYHLLLASFRKY